MNLFVVVFMWGKDRRKHIYRDVEIYIMITPNSRLIFTIPRKEREHHCFKRSLEEVERK